MSAMFNCRCQSSKPPKCPAVHKQNHMTNVVNDAQMSESNTVYPPNTSVFQQAQVQCFAVSFLKVSMMLAVVATPDS